MKKILWVLSVVFIGFIIVGCGSKKEEDNLDKLPQIIEAKEAEVSKDDSIGADMAELYYASDKYLIFHGSFGLFAYDLNEEKIWRSLDLNYINCNFTQGDNICKVSVSNDGEIVRLHSLGSKEMYTYGVKSNELIKTNDIRMEDEFILDKTPEMKGKLVTSYNCVKFDNGDIGYLTCSDGTLKTLKYLRGNKSYTLFK